MRYLEGEGRNMQPGAGLASLDQIEDKEKPAMGDSGLKGFSQGAGIVNRYRSPAVAGPASLGA